VAAAGDWPTPPARCGARAACDWRDKLALLRLAARWRAMRFECAPQLSVDDLLRATRRTGVATPAARPAVHLGAQHAAGHGQRRRVPRRDARCCVRCAAPASDLLVPRRPLARLLPLPALDWLGRRSIDIRLRERVATLSQAQDGWRLDAEGATSVADHVVLACSATEAARLTRTLAPAWSARAAALAHEPVVTLIVDLPARRWPLPMLALDSDADAGRSSRSTASGSMPSPIASRWW
jgi:hypothetical protein